MFYLYEGIQVKGNAADIQINYEVWTKNMV